MRRSRMPVASGIWRLLPDRTAAARETELGAAPAERVEVENRLPADTAAAHQSRQSRCSCSGLADRPGRSRHSRLASAQAGARTALEERRPLKSGDR